MRLPGDFFRRTDAAWDERLVPFGRFVGNPKGHSRLLRTSPPPDCAPSLAVTGLRLVVTTDHAIGLPVLRALCLCTCCRHYPGAATGGTALFIRPAISAFPDRVFGSACASSFSRLAQRLLALRPAHSRCHQFVARFTRRLQSSRYLHDCSGCFPAGAFAGWDLRALESAALSRRTPLA
jgi:hypothetical protein